MSELHIYDHSELVGIVSINKDGNLALEGQASARTLVDQVGAGLDAQQTYEMLKRLDNYPYCWTEEKD